MMPYYREVFVNEMTTVTKTGGPPLASPYTVRESVILTGHRAQPSRKAVSFKEIPDHVADPYAYFLSRNSRRAYQARLAERGLKADGEPDNGHPFSLIRHSIISRPSHYWNAGHNSGQYFIPKSSDTPLGSAMNVPGKSRNDLVAFGRDAYAKTAPTTVEWDAAQFLGELREGLPRLKPDLWKERTNYARAAASDYLNATFGWVPLVNEVKAAATALAKASFALQGVNSRVHRRMELPVQQTHQSGERSSTLYRVYGNSGLLSTAEALDAGYMPNANQQFGSGHVEWSELRTLRRWFEGSFTLFTPLGFNPDSFLDRLNQLVSLRLTPSVMWELTPWSWLVDWFLRVQDAIDAAEAAANDRLIMHYGYAMETEDILRRFDTRFSSIPKGVTGLAKTGHSYTTRTVYKTRIRANPYGFGLSTGNGLTTQQWSILAALALTKSPRS